MLSFILATAMIGFTLTACGEKSNGEEEPVSSVASAIDTDTELPIDVDKETIDYVKESEEEPVYVDDEDAVNTIVNVVKDNEGEQSEECTFGLLCGATEPIVLPLEALSGTYSIHNNHNMVLIIASVIMMVIMIMKW